MDESARDPVVRALLWRCFGRYVFRMSPYRAEGIRRAMLRACGASVARPSRIRRTVHIERPWNLTIGMKAAIGDFATLRGRGRVEIGDRCTISQLATITTEYRNPSKPGFPLEQGDVRLNRDSWVATDTLVLPDTRLGEGAIVGARSLAKGSYDAWTISIGEPARARTLRQIRESDA